MNEQQQNEWDSCWNAAATDCVWQQQGLPRPPMYGLPPPPTGHLSALYPELSSWHSPPGSPFSASSLRNPYHTTLANSPLARFSPPGLLPPPGIHPSVHSSHQGLLKCENDGSRLNGDAGSSGTSTASEDQKPRRPYVKKPLNAFMLFMKEMRQKVVEECTLKESAAINQILGRKWHALDRAEQAKYYDMARKEKELHMQLYPGWSARDNYATHTKKKKRKRASEGQSAGNQSVNSDYGNSQAKKCRARFGVEQQSQWCKPCRRKKKCIRFLTGDEEVGGSDLDSDACDELSVASPSSSEAPASPRPSVDGEHPLALTSKTAGPSLTPTRQPLLAT